MKILIIEDDPSLREIMTAFLEKERFVVEVAESLRSALFKLSDYDYDCILLDIMLPDGDGLTLLRKLREMDRSRNVIVISAKDSVEDKVAGLELGADDYLAKPFHLAELNARIRNVLRRKTLNGDTFVAIDNVRINTASFEVFVGNVKPELTRKEYDILLYFMTRPNHLTDKTRLAESVWGDHMDQVDNFDFIYAQIKNLRKKMNDAGAGIEIKAVYGLGYKLAVK
ncbi:MAG: response regulator transcription factor [Tannerella sp.]|jgi:DNA-binding response OmpR family regulator|nr:response regulator transcription factor [Tannerella sp.]